MNQALLVVDHSLPTRDRTNSLRSGRSYLRRRIKLAQSKTLNLRALLSPPHKFKLPLVVWIFCTKSPRLNDLVHNYSEEFLGIFT